MFGVTLAGSIALTDCLSGRLKSIVNSPTVRFLYSSQESSARFRAGSCAVPRKVPVGFRQVPVQFPARFRWVLLAARRVVRDGLKSSFQEDLNQELILAQ